VTHFNLIADVSDDEWNAAIPVEDGSVWDVEIVDYH
jgi:hypothetical protein